MAKIAKPVSKHASTSHKQPKSTLAGIGPRKSKRKRTRKTSKRDLILTLLKRSNGASIAELQKATGWQAHSVRGFLSGTIKKRAGLKLQSMPSKDGIRRYAVAD